jgi:hypothetical protein
MQKRLQYPRQFGAALSFLRGIDLPRPCPQRTQADRRSSALQPRVRPTFLCRCHKGTRGISCSRSPSKRVAERSANYQSVGVRTGVELLRVVGVELGALRQPPCRVGIGHQLAYQPR